MIRRLVIRNWRAYESADIPFEPGTTFVVAPNGVGKTSLLEAARWGLCGDRVQLPDSPVRLPARSAEVTVTVQLPGARILRIHRELFVDPKKRSTLEAQMAGRSLDAEELQAALEEAWGATVGFIGRGAFLTETFRRVPEDPDLRSQLCRVFGVTQLESDAVRLKQAVATLERELKGLRSDARAEAADMTRLVAELVEAEKEAAATSSRLSVVREEFDGAAAMREQARAAQEATSRLEAWQQRIEPLVTAAAAHVIDPAGDALLEQLQNATSKAETELDAQRQRRAHFEARMNLVREGLDELGRADDECPVCRRPLSAEDRTAADARHHAELRQLEAAAAELSDVEAAESLAALRTLVRQVAAAGPRPPLPVVEDSGAGPELADELDRSRLALEQAATTHREVEIRVESLRGALAETRAAEERSRELVAKHRHWALVEAAHRSLRGTVDELLERQITPLAEVVSDHWNRLFADRPHLRFDATGRLWRDVTGHELPYPAFSAGEQTAARLLLQLVVLTAATSAQFCWVDEPLEHLDPTTRRLVAGMLSRGKQATGLDQLVVTTYEEDLARRLAAADETTEILYVRAGAEQTESPAATVAD